jgi:hypothetical protein
MKSVEEKSGKATSLEGLNLDTPMESMEKAYKHTWLW